MKSPERFFALLRLILIAFTPVYLMKEAFLSNFVIRIGEMMFITVLSALFLRSNTFLIYYAPSIKNCGTAESWAYVEVKCGMGIHRDSWKHLLSCIGDPVKLFRSRKYVKVWAKIYLRYLIKINSVIWCIFVHICVEIFFILAKTFLLGSLHGRLDYLLVNKANSGAWSICLVVHQSSFTWPKRTVTSPLKNYYFCCKELTAIFIRAKDNDKHILQFQRTKPSLY